jgi:F420-dependent oxidoreductase-like protein
MRLGANIGYLVGRDPRVHLELAKHAEALGYDSVWVAEAYGSDSPTVLAWIAAQTTRIDIGSAVMQIPARTPAATAMTAATLDMLSAGRFRLGLGVSGPQVSEGWHGVRFEKPLGRTREYVEIVRDALARKTVRHHGEHFPLPLPGGPGKPLKLTLHPIRETIPIYLAAVGPKNLQLAGEIADGWLAIFFSPEYAGESMVHIAAGLERSGRTVADFDVVPSVPVVVGNDLQACADELRPYAALYVGGMGSRERNFYNQQAIRMGFEAAARRVQDLYLERQHREAMAAVPFEFIDQTSLIGPVERISERLDAFAAAGVTTLGVTSPSSEADIRQLTLRAVAEALDTSGLGD